MAHFPYIRAPGTWNSGSAFAPGEAELMNLYIFKAVNGDDGGTWAPSLVQIIIGGLGLQVTGPFQATNATVFDITGVGTVKTGGSLMVEAGCTFHTQSELRCLEGLYVERHFCLSTEVDTSAAGPTTLSNAYGHRVPTIGQNIVYVLPDPTFGHQHQLVTKVRTDAFTVTVQRTDGQIMGVIPSGQAGWIECMSRSSADNNWVVSKWSSNITSLYNGVSS